MHKANAQVRIIRALGSMESPEMKLIYCGVTKYRHAGGRGEGGKEGKKEGFTIEIASLHEAHDVAASKADLNLCIFYHYLKIITQWAEQKKKRRKCSAH